MAKSNKNSSKRKDIISAVLDMLKACCIFACSMFVSILDLVKTAVD